MPITQEDFDPADDDGQLHLNGIRGDTGLLLTPPLTLANAAGLAVDRPRDTAGAGLLQRFWEALKRPFEGLPEDVDPTDPASAGWAVVFAADVPAEVRAAVEPLVAHRRDHTRVPADILKVLEYPRGRPLEDWLRGIGAHPADVEPTRLPYYVTFVGGPDSIPFEHQATLDVHYAVGRLAFDLPEQYRQYVDSVIAYETAAAVPHGREVAYWGTRNRADRATQMSADCLVRPLFEGVPGSAGRERVPIAADRQFRSRCRLGPDATRASLAELLHGPDPASRPAFLFTASHGLGWPKGHERQLAEQGGLLCQDWPGLGTRPLPEHCLTAADVGDDARVHGLVAFLFACYGAGTPAVDHFLADRSRAPEPIAERSFVAALPQRLLSHPNGGALAVIGHVERAWGYSIKPPGLGPRLLPFRNLLGRVLRGEPVGHATKDFSDRYVSAALRIQNAQAGTLPGPRPREADLAAAWIERNDAQNYILLGDPAVRLRVDLMT